MDFDLFGVSVQRLCQGLLLVIVIMIDGSENKKKSNFFVKAAFEL